MLTTIFLPIMLTCKIPSTYEYLGNMGCGRGETNGYQTAANLTLAFALQRPYLPSLRSIV